MHLLNALVVVDNYDTEWLHNYIANIFEVVLKDAPVRPPHRIYRIEPKLLIKFNALLYSQVGIPFISNTVILIPSPEVVCRYPFQISEGQLVFHEILR